MKLPPQLEAEILANADRINGQPVNPPGSVTIQQVFARGRRAKPKDMVSERVTGFSVLLPIVTASEANGREWAKRHKRSQAALATWNRFAARMLLPKLPLPLTITLTRLGGKKLDRWDNLPVAMKGCLDAVCGWLQIDDGDDRLTVKYEQRPGGQMGVAVKIEATEDVT